MILRKLSNIPHKNETEQQNRKMGQTRPQNKYTRRLYNTLIKQKKNRAPKQRAAANALHCSTRNIKTENYTLGKMKSFDSIIVL